MPTQTIEQKKLSTAEVDRRFKKIVKGLGDLAVVDFERNKRFEIVTDLAERIGYPIDITIPYQLHDDGLHALSDTRERPFHDQTAEALARGAKFTGDQSFEQVRLQHEHEEALMVDALARGELAGNVLIKISRVPDAVANNLTDIRGYRRDLLRSFVRIYWLEGNNVFCRLFTLDHNNQRGLESVGQLAGIIVQGQSSEDLLAQSQVIDVPAAERQDFVDGLVKSMKRTYDESMLAETGQITHAGSSLASQRDAHALVNEHQDLIDNLAQTLSNTGDDEERAEAAYKYAAAAIVLRKRGLTASDGAVAAEVSNGDYGRECPTAPNGMNQANQEALKNWKRRVDECPLCHCHNVMAEKKGEIITDLDNGCTLNVCTGEKYIPATANVTAKDKQNDKNKIPDKQAEKAEHQRSLQKKFGIWAVSVIEWVDGKRHEVVRHWWNRKVLADLGRVATR